MAGDTGGEERTVTHPFPAAASVPSAQAVCNEILPAYPIGRPARCCLHMSGVNDVYLVWAGEDRYVLKIYRAGWRSSEEVLYELDLLAHLHRNGVAVSLPVPRRDGQRITEVPALEGVRPAVLFRHAPGKQPAWPFYEDEAESRLMGATLAAIHGAADDFSSTHERTPYDASELLDRTLTATHPFLAHRELDWQYLLALVERLRRRLTDLVSRGLSWGVCHGDFHCGNAFITDDCTVTVFDFDVCGPGWLAFDLARWKSNPEGKTSHSWSAFLQGYREKRAPTDTDLEAVPLFVALRTLHWTQIKATFTARGAWGCWDMEFYLNDTLASLKRWESKALGTG
jgi:Ser/Thr protein kinase RdoA (MazF antagonist)